MDLKGEVVRITPEGSCQVRIANEILVVFPVPLNLQLEPADLIMLRNIEIDGVVCVENLTRGNCFEIRLCAKDIHDLRRPTTHGELRTPNSQRINEA